MTELSEAVRRAGGAGVAGDTIEVPDSINGFTAEFLTEAMRQRVPGIVVEEAEQVDFIHGASSKLRMRIRTNRNDIPNSIIVKGGFEAHSRVMRDMHANEINAYRVLVPTLAVNTVDCYYAGLGESGDGLVILEDLNLRGVGFLRLMEPIGFELAKAFLTEIARIHARWWNAPELDSGPQFAWLQDASEHGGGIWQYFAILNDPEQYGWFRNAPRAAAMPTELLDPPRIHAAHSAMIAAHAKEPVTICHGDTHLGNLFVTAEGEPAFLDWMPRKGPWSLDVSYFITAALDYPRRREWEGPLLQHYLAALAGFGVEAPSFPHAWHCYRREMIWGFIIWLLNSSDYQTEANNTAAAARFATAMIDHDTFGILGV
jgi:hypothetical protein